MKQARRIILWMQRKLAIDAGNSISQTAERTGFRGVRRWVTKSFETRTLAQNF